VFSGLCVCVFFFFFFLLLLLSFQRVLRKEEALKNIYTVGLMSDTMVLRESDAYTTWAPPTQGGQTARP